MKLPIIGITAGDPCGIGPEIVVKSLAQPGIYSYCSPLVIADTAVIKEALKITGKSLNINRIAKISEGSYKFGTIDVFDTQLKGIEGLEYGKITRYGGKASFRFIENAIKLAMEKSISAVVTGPIHKKALHIAGYDFAGHTEIFANMTKTDKYCMLLVHGNDRVSHVTTHVPLKQVPALINDQRVYDVILLTYHGLIKLGIKDPAIGVAGLNPHAGDEGLFGCEDIELIAPAVKRAKSLGVNVEGPIPPDTVFVKMKGRQYNAVVAMYHDQGHIPLKLNGFEFDETNKKWKSVGGVNITLGLPIIRTSVDHGVAFGKAGQGSANHQSMVDAIALAAKMVTADEGFDFNKEFKT